MQKQVLDAAVSLFLATPAVAEDKACFVQCDDPGNRHEIYLENYCRQQQTPITGGWHNG